MGSPLKPWESLNDGADAGATNGSFWGGENGASRPGGPSVPPPVPPRPDAFAVATPYGGYGGNYGGYGGSYGGYGNYGGYGSYGGYGNYGGYGSLYSSYGRWGATEGPLARAAEHGSRPAFQSVEALVQAFGSVAMMLESSYQALLSSFRAVVGVADQASRLRDSLGRILSALALVRAVRALLGRILVRTGFTEECAAWEAAASGEDAPAGPSIWPVLVFLGFVVGAPWLLWKMVSSTASAAGRWASGRDVHYAAVALYDFAPAGNSELRLVSGQELRLAPRELQPRIKGWLLASVDGRTTGLVPADYVRVLGVRRGGPANA